MERIPVAGPWITHKEIEYVTDAVTRCWHSSAGEYHQRFESAFAEYIGTRYAVTLPSCTSAIHLSLAALGVGPGDEVIVPDVTWIASAAPISYVGAQPVFADVDPHSWCLPAKALEACITDSTKAVILVDLYGSMSDMDAIREIADRHQLPVIEDAAEAFGSEYKGSKAGSFGDTGVFSFHGSKTMTTGEGGMLVTDREDVYQRVLFLRDHGRQPGDVGFFNREVAFKYKMSSMQAALGLAQVERAEELVTRKREIFAWYAHELGDLGLLTLNREMPGVKNTYWMVTAIVDPELGVRKERLIEQMADLGVSCRPFFHPLSSIPAYQGTTAATQGHKRNLVSYRISPYGINLPSGMSIEREDVRYVARSLVSLLDRYEQKKKRRTAA